MLLWLREATCACARADVDADANANPDAERSRTGDDRASEVRRARQDDMVVEHRH